MAVNKPYNDGVVLICREARDPSSFAARQGAVTMDDLDPICALDFAEQSRRMQDSDYANQMGYRLDRKIAVRRPGGIRIDTECSAVIGTTLYHVGDADYTQTEIYLQLTEVGQIAR